MQQAIETNTISAPASETPIRASVNLLPPSPTTVMACILRTMGSDLGDEREVIRVLIGAKFKGRQVVALMDEAMALACARPAG